MTIREIIEFVDEIFPNTFSPETKTRWLSQCDAAIWNDVMLLPAYSFPGYRWDFDADRPLLAPEAYEQMYVHWLCAQMHKAHQEIAEYANDAELYNAFLRRFVIWYADTFDPAHGGMMPLPPVTTFRKGDDATVLLTGFPWKLSNVTAFQIRILRRDGAEILDDSDKPFFWPQTDPARGDYIEKRDEYIVLTFPNSKTLTFEPGMYDVLLSVELANGQMQQIGATGTWRISVLEQIAVPNE